jgi:hypothetical protein
MFVEIESDHGNFSSFSKYLIGITLLFEAFRFSEANVLLITKFNVVVGIKFIFPFHLRIVSITGTGKYNTTNRHWRKNRKLGTGFRNQ